MEKKCTIIVQSNDDHTKKRDWKRAYNRDRWQQSEWDILMKYIYITFENVSPHLYDTNKLNKTTKKRHKNKGKTLSAWIVQRITKEVWIIKCWAPRRESGSQWEKKHNRRWLIEHLLCPALSLFYVYSYLLPLCSLYRTHKIEFGL